MKTVFIENGFIRLSKLLEIYPVGKSTLYRKISNGEFPKPYKIGPKTSVWSIIEVNEALARITEAEKEESMEDER